MDPVVMPPSRSLAAEVGSRVASHWRLKCIGTTIFIVVFFIGYFLLLRFPLFPVTVMPLTIVDSWVGFHPGMLWLYLSLWLYVSLPPTLLRTRPELFSFCWLAMAVALLGLAIFLCWPTAAPVVSEIDWKGAPGFVWLKGVDAAQNACPSLHVAFAVFSGVWLDRLLRTLPDASTLRVLNLVWGLGIVYSTMATRQHVAVDVAAGAALGLLGAWPWPRALKTAGRLQVTASGS